MCSMSRAIILIGVCLAYSTATIKDDDRLGLAVRRHQSCPTSSDWKPAIVMADDTSAPLSIDRNRPGCYSLTGDLRVNRKVSSNLQVYIELRTEASTVKRPQPCQGADDNGCGGYGSCVYCGDCSTIHSKDLKGADVSLRQNGKVIACNDIKLEPGIHKDIELSFCMPKFKEFLRAFDLNRQTFNDLLGHTDKQSLYMWVYVFDADETDIARLARIDHYQLDSLRDRQYAQDIAKWQQEVINASRKGTAQPSKPLKRPYELSETEYNRTNMQKLLNKKEYVACHRIMATLYYDNKDAPIISSSRHRRNKKK